MAGIARAVGVEAAKLRTLPLAPLALWATVLVAAAVGAALALQAVERSVGAAGAPAPSAGGAALQTVPFVQAGLVLLGLLPVAHEYTGRQLGTTLTAVPARGRVIAAKTAVALGAAAVCAALAMAVAWAAAAGALAASGEPWAARAEAGAAGDELARMAGAVVYLTLMALLAHAAALLLPGLVPPLVAVLALVLLVSPMLSALGEWAAWLPDRAAARLYAAAEPLADSWPEPLVGALVCCAWVAAVLGAGAVRFMRSPA